MNPSINAFSKVDGAYFCGHPAGSAKPAQPRCSPSPSFTAGSGLPVPQMQATRVLLYMGKQVAAKIGYRNTAFAMILSIEDGHQELTLCPE